MIKDIVKKVFKEYWIIIVTIFLVSITGGVSYATFVYNDSSDRVSEMYVSKLDYDISISGQGVNSYSCENNICNVDMEDGYFVVNITSNELVDTYFKLVHNFTYNTSLKYNNNTEPYGVISPNETKKIDLVLSWGGGGSFQFEVVGGFINNTLNDVVISDSYFEITTPITTNTLVDNILSNDVAYADNVNSENVYNSPEGIDYSNQTTTLNGEGLYYTTDLSRTEDYDGDGTGERVYFYRGNIENNFVLFADKCWRIVRTNEDGSIKLIYSGEHNNFECYSERPEYSNNYHSIGISSFNNSNEDNAFLGYMYGDAQYTCEEGYCRIIKWSSSYDTAQSNNYDSTVKTFIDNWYETNILIQGTGITDKIANTIYCNNRKIAGEDENYNGSDSQLGYGTNDTTYAARSRISNVHIPQYKCEQQNDEFTLKVSAGGTDGYGNNALKYPVGLLTVDELIYSGIGFGLSDSIRPSSFLRDFGYSWTMSASLFYYGTARNFRLSNNSFVEEMSVDDEFGYVHPVISLKSDISTIYGNGFSNNPYIIE